MSNAGSDTHDLARRAWVAQQAGSGSIPGDAIANDGIDSAQIAAGAVDPEHVAPDTAGANVAADHADTSPVTVLAADPNVDRAVIFHVVCTETVAGDDTPTWSLGEEGDATKFATTAVFAANATAGDAFTVSGTLSSTKAAIVTLADGGTTTNDAGAFNVVAIAGPIS